MVMTIEPNGVGGLSVGQKMVRPLVYFDHWAVRLFSDEPALADRFIAALRAAEGTWLFSQANLSEFIAMKDVETARRVEAFIANAFPNLYVIDLVLDTDIVRERDPNAPRDPEAPDPHWMLQDLGQRALIANGAFNSHRFISDAISHADTLLAGFTEMKKMIAGGVIEMREKVLAEHDRKDLVPRMGMRLKEALRDELLFEPTAQEGQKFHENDATDFVHALPACLLCDMVLLDLKWCYKVAVAERRIREAGIEGRIAACFSPREIEAFLLALEARSKHA